MRTANTQKKSNLLKAGAVSCRDGELFEHIPQ